MQLSNDSGAEPRPGHSSGADGPISKPAGKAAPFVDVGPTKWIWAWVVPAALVAGVLAWLVGEATLDTFVPTPAEMKSGASSYVPVDNTPYLKAKRRVAIYNTALHYGILGVGVGLALGLAGGLSRRSARGVLVGGGLGSVACGTTAVLASLALIPVFLSRYNQDQPNLFLPMFIHGGIWSAIGASGGLGFGLGLGGRPGRIARIALGGAAGAILGTVTYEILHAVAFPLARGESPIPSEPTIRLLAHLMVVVSIALGATWISRAGGGEIAA